MTVKITVIAGGVGALALALVGLTFVAPHANAADVTPPELNASTGTKNVAQTPVGNKTASGMDIYHSKLYAQVPQRDERTIAIAIQMPASKSLNSGTDAFHAKLYPQVPQRDERTIATAVPPSDR